MSHPYLPVNPCCTDTIIHTPCSTNTCGTNLTVSSSVVYDGPELVCIFAEPCDTLNVILQKIDQIICNLLLQINSLSTQINNLTTQVIAINSNITNIFNILDVCCVATTTTSSTTQLPVCENFSLNNTGVETVAIITTDCITGELVATLLHAGLTNICVQTNSPLVVPGTIVVTPNGPCGPTTTTTTTLEPTTTTTTTLVPCDCLTFVNTDEIAHTIVYLQCDNNLSRVINLEGGEILKVCGCCALADDPTVTVSVGSSCIEGSCPEPPPVECVCFQTTITIPLEVLDATDNKTIIYTYFDCENNPLSIVYTLPGTFVVGCVNYFDGPVGTGIVGGINTTFLIPTIIGDACCIVTTTTTTTVTVYSNSFSVGTGNNALACLETVGVLTLFSSSPTFAFGSFVYTDAGLTTIFNGGDLYYKNLTLNNGIRVPVSGQINSTFSC